MKRLFSLILLFQAFLTHAQPGENFGRIAGNEYDLKECSFDPDATAVVLLDEGVADHDDNYSLLTYNHRRIKILKPEGIGHGDVSIKFYSGNDFNFVNNIRAVTINLDENGNRKEFPVEKKNIYVKKVNEHLSEVSFAFPQVQVGSILEYQYRLTQKHFGFLDDWTFQHDLPVYKSRFSLTPAPNLEFTYLVQKSPQFPIDITPTPTTGMITFEMKEIPALHEEPYMDAREDYQQMVRFQITKIAGSTGVRKYMSSWNEVARELRSRSSFGGQLKVNIPEEQKTFVASISAYPDLQKMAAVYNYIRRQFQWNRFGGVDADPGLKQLYAKKTGNSAAINFALINLLTASGLDALPFIVSERSNGRINTSIPFANQFNDTYATVLIDGKRYFLDATNPVTPAHLVPTTILNTTGLIVKKSDGELVKAEPGVRKYQDNIHVTSVLSAEGELTGRVQVVSSDYSKAERLYSYNRDSLQFFNRILTGGLGNVAIEKISLANTNTDSIPLKQEFDFNTHAQGTGDYVFLSLNMFSGFESNPFVRNTRFSDINFGYNRTLVINNVITIPADMVVDAVPKKLRLINEDNTLTFTREVNVEKASGIIIARLRIDISRSNYLADEYTALQEFYKKLNELLGEQIVLKKKES